MYMTANDVPQAKIRLAADVPALAVEFFDEYSDHLADGL